MTSRSPQALVTDPRGGRAPGPHAVSVTLPSTDTPSITVGCAPCRHDETVELSIGGVAAAQAFLRRHVACLAAPGT
jgi:hypothetical protein